MELTHVNIQQKYVYIYNFALFISGTRQNMFYDDTLYRTKTRNRKDNLQNPYFNHGQTTCLRFEYKTAILVIHTLTNTKQRCTYLHNVDAQARHAKDAPN